MNEVIEVMTGFFREALKFLEVPEKDWPEVVVETRFDEEHKLTPPYLDYANSKFIIHAPFVMVGCSLNTPTAHRNWSYMNAWKWHRYLKTGEVGDRLDAEAILFSHALMSLKGIQLSYSAALNPDAIADFITTRLKISVKVSNGVYPNGEIYPVVRYTDSECERRLKQLKNLADKSRLKRPSKIKRGSLGSREKPFENVDEAANYILCLEKEALRNDVYRKFIADEPFYFDFESGIFRIPWASANVGYYDSGDNCGNGFVVNQLQSGRFSLKPILRNHKFLFRGQCEYYDKCKPSLFRPQVKDKKLSELMQTFEMMVLLKSHPLVKLFGQGVEIFHDWFRFEMNYLGLSQHYYNRTEYLDLTSRIGIAKFFAVTSFDFDNDRYVKYEGEELGVLYFYDIEPDSFRNAKYGTRLSTIGKQVFMRSGNQAGFLLKMRECDNFNNLPNVRAVFFKHDKTITDRIFSEFDDGNYIMPEELLRKVWYKRMSNPDLKNRISRSAVKEYIKEFPNQSEKGIILQLESEGITIVEESPEFTEDELSIYYSNALRNWQEFVSDIYFHSPEGIVLKRHLINLPEDKRYRWAFVK